MPVSLPGNCWNLEQWTSENLNDFGFWEHLIPELPPLVLDNMALPQTDFVHNLEIAFDSQFLFKEQVAAIARRAFSQPHVQQLCLFLDREALVSFTYAWVTSQMDYCNVLYMWQPLRSTLEGTGGPKCSSMGNFVCSSISIGFQYASEFTSRCC